MLDQAGQTRTECPGNKMLDQIAMMIRRDGSGLAMPAMMIRRDCSLSLPESSPSWTWIDIFPYQSHPLLGRIDLDIGLVEILLRFFGHGGQ